jgi:hypothetical protein
MTATVTAHTLRLSSEVISCRLFKQHIQHKRCVPLMT